MKILNPIGLEEQLSDCLEGKPAECREAAERKIDYVTKHIDKVRSVIGKKVFEPFAEGKYIYFYLNKHSGPEYNYPVQYATIEIEE